MKALSFDDISLVPRYNNIASRRDVDTSVRFGNLTLRVPILSSNMDTVTGHRMARSIYGQGGLGFLHRFCSIEDNVTMYNDATFEWQNTRSPRLRDSEAVVSLGVNEGLDRFHALHQQGARHFCIDIAHGHSESVGQMVQKIKEYDDATFVIAGNVCHAAGAEYLAAKGADAVKVGIGPGSVCSTRIKTGFGVPQFTAIQDCRRVNCLIIADGGIRTPGDAVKAFVAGADVVMLGGMLAGTNETPGDITVQTDGNGDVVAEYKMFRGMASKEAQDEFMGTMNDWKTAEGVETTVTAKGPVSAVIGDLMGGIRSGCTYCGANNIQQLKERAAYVEVTAAGRIEGTPHGQNRL
jgi:IMP dehydrogenase